MAPPSKPPQPQPPGDHPLIPLSAILDLAKARPIKHLMVNTNGIRIAGDRASAAATFQPTQISGRLENFDPATGKLTPTEV